VPLALWYYVVLEFFYVAGTHPIYVAICKIVLIGLIVTAFVCWIKSNWDKAQWKVAMKIRERQDNK